MKKKHVFSNYQVKDSETYECVENSGWETQFKEEQKKNNAQTTIVKVLKLYQKFQLLLLKKLKLLLL